jgi:hypothetical protein
MAGLLGGVGALAALVAALWGDTTIGGILLAGLVLVGLWPISFLLWVAASGMRFARARDRTRRHLTQEISRCKRLGDRIVVVLLRFPEARGTAFPLFPSHRGALDALRGCFRSYDHIERIGFTRYVMVLPGTDSLGVMAVRERLLDAVRREHRWRIRVGLSIHPEDGLTPEILLDHATRHCA